MRIIQLIECLSCGDGIGNHTILTHHLLKQAGYQVKTYAGEIAPNVPKGIARLFSDRLKADTNDILLLQFGISGPISERIASFPCRKIMVYHNITPPEFFSEYDFEMYERTKQGYRLVEKWRKEKTFDAVFAVSPYNHKQLLSMGFSEESTVCLPGCLVPFGKYREAPDLSTLKKYGDGITNILFVGRISPNKKQQDIVRAFAYYQRHIDQSARLIFAGGGGDSAYGRSLKDFVKNLNLEHVIFPGYISSATLSALYQCAHIFVCMSEHEGFCIPLIEAMFFDVPILAYRAAAIPDTLGDSGVLLEQKDPVLTAKWIERIVKDKTLRQKILLEQRSRLKDFDQEVIGLKILNAIDLFIRNTNDGRRYR